MGLGNVILKESVLLFFKLLLFLWSLKLMELQVKLDLLQVIVVRFFD